MFCQFVCTQELSLLCRDKHSNTLGFEMAHQLEAALSPYKCPHTPRSSSPQPAHRVHYPWAGPKPLAQRCVFLLRGSQLGAASFGYKHLLLCFWPLEL